MKYSRSVPFFDRRRPQFHVLRKTVAAVCVAACALAFSSSAPVAHAAPAPTLNWISWTAPGSFPNAGSFLEDPQYPPYTYDYATQALGTIAMPDNSTVYVKFNGEVVSKNGNSGPSGFGVTGSTYWSGRLYSASGQAYISTNVPSWPTNGDRIGVVGNYIASQTLSFYSDSNRTQPVNVSNIVMNIYSLGGPTLLGAWDFNQVFSILSDNRSVNSTYGFAKSAPTSGTHRLSAREGTGTIQFNGTFNSISWTVTQPEAFATWNIGVTSSNPPLDVTFDSQGGSSIAAQTTTVGGSLTDPGTPTRQGYTFAGWFTSGTGGSPVTFPFAHGQNTAFTLFAQWTAAAATTIPATTTTATPTTTAATTTTIATPLESASTDKAKPSPLPSTGQNNATTMILAIISTIAGFVLLALRRRES